MEKEHALFNKTLIILLVLVLLLGIGGVGFFVYENYNLKGEMLVIRTESASIKHNLESKISELIGTLASTTADRDTLLVQLTNERAMVEMLGGQVKSISGDVGTLVKLSKTDPELLKKYSKVSFLNENYAPPKLIPLDTKYTYNQKEQFFEGDAWPFLQLLIDAATAAGNNLQIISGYRSFDSQSGLKNSYKVTYGAGTANQFSADQGYSEHQLGTAADFTNSALGANFDTFDKTKEYTWLTANAYKFGFVLSYPKNNTYYVYEPWHWRFVGKSLALALHTDNKYFYDLDQSEIDKYLATFFDQ